jgi:DNA polymerase-3 subunit gamma/tau
MWDTKYRPRKFSEVLGQEGSVQLIKARLRNGTILNTSYIFAGGHGQGKTTLARVLARAALCQNLNREEWEPCNVCEQCLAILEDQPSAFTERDAASNGGVANVRDLLEDLPYMPPMGAPIRIYLFDEAHRMSKEAQDVLLKPIEEKKLLGIFCTTEPQNIRGTIQSRCETYPIRKVTREDVLGRMRMVLETEKVEYQDDAVLIVIDHSGGHVRDILNKLEMIAQMGSVTVESVREYLHLSVVSTYYQILLALGNPKQALELVDQACERVPADQVAAGLAEAAMNSFRLANNMAADFVYVDRQLAEQVYQRFTTGCTKLAEYFLRHRAVSRISLVCDIVSLAQSNGAVPQQMGAQPLVLSVSAPMAVASVPVQTAAVQATPSTPPAVSQPVSAPSPVTTAAPPSPSPAPQVPIVHAATNGGNGKMRADGIGAIGSGDPYALTSEDHKAVPLGRPRSRSNPGNIDVPLSFHQGTEDEMNRILTPEDWRREFERTWPRRA